MANKNDWLKAAGMGLMGYAKYTTDQRRIDVEQQRADTLQRASEGRMGYDKELLGLMKLRDKTAQDKDMATRQSTAIESIQKRIDAVIDPDDYAAREYMQQRSIILEQAADLGSEEMGRMLAEAEAAYRDGRLAILEVGSEEYKAREAGMDSYVGKIHDIVKTGNAKMKHAFGDDFSADLYELMYLTPAARSGPDDPGVVEEPPPETVVDPALEEDSGPGLMDVIGDPSGAVESIGDTLRGYSLPDESTPGRIEAGKAGFDRGIRFSPEDAANFNPATGRLRPPVHRDLRIDPQTGQLITPGPRTPGT